jgi:hypothetical protein
LVGSGATGCRDDDSDIDLVAPVAAGYDAAGVFHDWQQRIRELVPVRYLAQTTFTEQQRLLVVLCADRLEIDLSFPPIGAVTGVTPQSLRLWDRSGEVRQHMALPPGARCSSSTNYGAVRCSWPASTSLGPPMQMCLAMMGSNGTSMRCRQRWSRRSRAPSQGKRG